MAMDRKINNIALLVIDVQTGLFERLIPIYDAKGVLKNINTLINRARNSGVPVIFIQHSNDNSLVYGSDKWQLHPEIQPIEDEALIHKLEGDAFSKTELNDVLETQGIGKLVVTGLVTHGCVRATTLGALKLGYKVVLASDGHSNFSKDAKKLVAKWNKTLSEKGVDLIETKEIVFGGSRTS
jgi:nicotinamidase-related amidase